MLKNPLLLHHLLKLRSPYIYIYIYIYRSLPNLSKETSEPITRSPLEAMAPTTNNNNLQALLTSLNQLIEQVATWVNK
jgi:hypothetical protein